MELEKIKLQYNELIKSADPFDIIFDFKENLLSSDDEAVLQFHYDILSNREDESIYHSVRSFFDKRQNKDAVSDFLFKKYKEGIKDIVLKADVIQILGHLRSKYARPVALENIIADKGELRYRSIIVLGWVGDESDVKTLNDRLLNDKDPQLRGYAATAMRQIWFNHPKAKDAILAVMKRAIAAEKDEKTLEGIIITSQDLLKKKLGLKESKYGDVSGDIIVAKAKTITALENY